MGFSFGPRILRVHINKRSTGISSGIGWITVSGHTRRSGSGRSGGSSQGSDYVPPTPAEISAAKATHISKLRQEGWLVLEGKDAPKPIGQSSFLVCRDRPATKITSMAIWLILLFPFSWIYYGLKIARGGAGQIQYRHYYLDSGLQLHWKLWHQKSETPDLRIVESSMDLNKKLDEEVENLFGTHSILSRNNSKVVMASRTNPSNLVTLEIKSSGSVSKKYSKEAG